MQRHALRPRHLGTSAGTQEPVDAGACLKGRGGGAETEADEADEGDGQTTNTRKPRIRQTHACTDCHLSHTHTHAHNAHTHTNAYSIDSKIVLFLLFKNVKHTSVIPTVG